LVRNAIVLIVVIAVVFIMLVAGRRMRERRAASGTLSAGNVNGQLAPDFTLKSTDGKQVKLSDLRGKAVLLNFWATWCAPCVKEMPSLDRLAAEMPDVAVLAASVDIKGAEIVAPFLEAHKIERLSILLDPKAGGLRGFGFRGLPSTIVIDREGRARGKLEGAAEWDSAEAKALLRFYADER